LAARRGSVFRQAGAWGRQKEAGYFRGRKEVEGAESSRCRDFGEEAAIEKGEDP